MAAAAPALQRHPYVRDLPKPQDEGNKTRDFLLNFQEDGEYKYFQQLQEISNRQRKLLVVYLDDVMQFKNDQDFVRNIEENTMRYVKYFEEEADKLMPPPTIQLASTDVIDVLENQRMSALQQAAPQGQAVTDSDLPKNLLRRYEVVFIPLAEAHDRPRKLREIKAQSIGKLVSIKGLVTRSTDVKPRIAVCTYTCDFCGAELFQDVVGNSFMPVTECISQRCKENKTKGRITLQTRGSKFVKYQELRVQELPDQVPVGHIPRALTIHCSGELTRLCCPGDVIKLAGVSLPIRQPGYRGMLAGLQVETFIEAFHIEKQKESFNALLNSDRNSRIVREIARDPDPYSRLARSIAPEIYGHEDVKKALLLQLVGGVTKDLSDGLRIRGDINICLMGDPGVAKSQLLKYIATVAPRGVYTTGKGSSGVGLTAAVVRDNLTGELTLEGGALVLADMGVCCIDEFDKMDENDRTAIHEVMEQQTISVAKAGITTTLNARAAVLAAANPLYGRYNVYKSISENVDLPNSLLSRFDLLFLILDKADQEKDLALSRHVLNVHTSSAAVSHGTTSTNNSSTTTINNANGSSSGSTSHQADALPPEAFKQYIATARVFNPVVPEELVSYIVDAYVSMRQCDPSLTGATQRARSLDNNQAVMTPRQLLSILRLAQALARLRLSDLVSHEDVDEAIRLTHASKASLREHTQNAQSFSQEDAMSQIFNAVCDLAAQRNTNVLEHTQVEAMILKKGFTAEQLKRTLAEYQALAVITIESATGNIIIEG